MLDETVAVKNSTVKSNDVVRRAVVLSVITLLTVGACADVGRRHVAPPPQPLDTAAIAGGASASAFAGAIAAPPDLAQQSRGERGGGDSPAREPDLARPAEGDAAVPSILARLNAEAAPFSGDGDGAGYDAPMGVALASGELPGQGSGANPTRTAMRVRPVTPPFSGPRAAAEEPDASPFTAPPARAMMAGVDAPAARPVAPFYGSRSAREALRDGGAPLGAVRPIFADSSDPEVAYAPPAFAAPAAPLPWDAVPAASSADVETDYQEGRALDDPMFRSDSEAFATVIVSNSGVEVVADAADRGAMVFAALPSDPGGWTNDQFRGISTVSMVDVAVDPMEAATPSGDMIATLLFDNGSVDVGEDERQILREVARIQKLDDRPVTLVGHASGRTWADNALAQRRTNLRISRQRAEAVARTLDTYGVTRSKIAIVPKGDTQPLYAELMASGEAGNRRVEVYLGY